MTICPYREAGGMESGRGKLVSCRIVSQSLGWWHAFVPEVCDQCLDETGGPIDHIEHGRSNTVDVMVRDKLLHAISFRATDDRIKTVFKATRHELIQRALKLGMSQSQIDHAQRQAGLPVRVERPLLPRPLPQAPKKKKEIPSWASSLKAVRERKKRPCVHIHMNDVRVRHVCSCGPVYPCDLHKECVISQRQDKFRSCLFCKDYVEKVPARPRIDLQVVIGVTTCPVMKTKRNDKGHRVATDEVDCWRDTLPVTLQSILAAGWTEDQVTIFAEPFSHVPDGWRVIWRERRLGPWWNVYQGMKQLSDEHPDAHQLWVEDDTVLASGLREELNRRGGFPSDKCGILRVFRMSGMGQKWVSADQITEPRRSDGYQKVMRGKYLWGSNAILLSNNAIKAVLGTDGNYPPGLSCSPDVKFGVLLPKLGYDEWCCNPSLAQTDHRLPSTAGHRVSSKMTADTFLPSLATSEPLLEKELKIHIVRPNDGWILQEIGESFIGVTNGTKPDMNADCNVYVNYSLMPATKSACDVGYFTHRENGERGAAFDAAATRLDWCIAMSETTLKLLPEHKSSLLKPSVHERYKTRSLIVGVCTREYPRKRLDILENIAKMPGVDLRLTGGKIKSDDMVRWFSDIDYLLVTSSVEGGPMPVLEAMSLRKPVIAPDVGWCWDYPVIKYADDEELLEIVERLVNPVETWETQSQRLAEICKIAVRATKHRPLIGDRYLQLIELIRKHKPASIIEVGSWNGDRALQMVQEALRWRPILHYEGYDLFDSATSETDSTEFNNRSHPHVQSVAAKLDKVRKSYPGFSYDLHRGNTRTTLINRTADFVFIDGGHSVDTIRHDLRMLQASKVIVLDDWYEPDELGRSPDISRFGCNIVVNGKNKAILPIAGRVAGGGLVRMVLINEGE